MGENMNLISNLSSKSRLSSFVFFPGRNMKRTDASHNLNKADRMLFSSRMTFEMVPSRWDPESSSCPRKNARAETLPNHSCVLGEKMASLPTVVLNLVWSRRPSSSV